MSNIHDIDPKRNRKRSGVAGIISLSLLAVVLFSLFIFFGDARDACKDQMLVTVSDIRDSAGIRLVLTDAAGVPYHPQIINRDVVISSGSRVRVCYEAIDTLADGSLQLRIIDVVALP